MRARFVKAEEYLSEFVNADAKILLIMVRSTIIIPSEKKKEQRKYEILWNFKDHAASYFKIRTDKRRQKSLLENEGIGG